MAKPKLEEVLRWQKSRQAEKKMLKLRQKYDYRSHLQSVAYPARFARKGG